MLINFYVFLAVLFLCAGLAVDAGMVQVRRLALQHAADAAALGALYEKSRGSSGWVAAGQTDAALNGFANGVNGVTLTISSPPTSGAYAGDDTAIQTSISQTYQTAFMGLLGSGGVAVPTAVAVAKITTNPDCIYIMGAPSGSYSFYNKAYSGFYPHCNVYINSTSQSLYDDSGSTITAYNSASIKVQGASGTAYMAGPVSPTPTFNSPVETDPLAYVAEPASPASAADCTYTSTNITQPTTLYPGTYCNGLNITGVAVTLKPGLYIVTGGMAWSGGATVTGSGVMIYLTSGAGYGYGDVTIFNTTVSLSAPTSSSGGAIAGIVMFADRGWVTNTWSVFINASYVSTDGIWYLPGVGLSNYNSTLTGPDYIGLVTYSLFTTGATFTFPSPNYASVTGGNPFQGSATGSLVE